MRDPMECQLVSRETDHASSMECQLVSLETDHASSKIGRSIGLLLWLAEPVTDRASSETWVKLQSLIGLSSFFLNSIIKLILLKNQSSLTCN